MKKFQRELSIFFITSVPCFVLASVFFLFVKEDVIFSIIAFTHSLFLVCVSFWLRQELMTDVKRICDKETAYQDLEPLYKSVEELQKQVQWAKNKISIHESHILLLEKKQDKQETISSTEGDPTKAFQVTESELKTEGFSFSCNIKGIEDKDELTSGDRFSIMRNGRGVMTLNNFRLLTPSVFGVGQKITPEMHDLWKSYCMDKFFDSSSRDMIDSRIIKIIPAEIQIMNDKNKDEFQGVLLKKGKIELDERI